MKQIIISFDIDGTLISNEYGLGKEHLNTDVFHLMVLLKKTIRNSKIIVWSSGGRDYAEQVVSKYGLEEWVDMCYGKSEYDETIYGKVDICFDDISECRLADKNLIINI